MESYSEAKIDLFQPKEGYIKGLPVPLGIFIKYLYILVILIVKQRIV